MGFISDNEQKNIIRDNLSYYINLTGKDQKDIAIELDVNPPTFNQWVNGKAIPSVTTLKRLAAYFGIGLTNLVNRQDITEESIDITEREKNIIKAYRGADKGIKEAVNKLLDIKEQ